MKKFITAPIFASLLTAGSLHAAVKLPALFSDHAVLQRDAELPVWGWADAGEEITVSLGDKSVTAQTGANGRWSAKLPKMDTGGPFDLTVKCPANTITVHDVLVGDVWLGSGQSNMAMTVSRAQDFEGEKTAATEKTIRMFTEKSGASTKAQAECKGEWLVCSADTVGSFSATLYFFGREIQRELKVPVGLINSSVGGTPIESWIDADAQRAKPELADFFAGKKDTFDAAAAKALYDKQVEKWQASVKKAKADKKPLPRKPVDPVAMRERKANVGGLFNGKIAPLIPYAIRGALWYQGEANSTPEKSRFYEHQLTLLVSDWRKRWGSEFPFAWVQLPNFVGRGDGWCQVREGMFKSLRQSNTGMAVTIDIGDPTNIHPANKQEVGRRLSKWALGSVYAKPIAVSGPRFADHVVRGNEIVLNFSHTDGNLLLKDDGKGFVVAGTDKVWHEGKARIEGNSIVVSSPEVASPVAARYAWAEVPAVSLWNGAGLPASPFRTDDWALVFAPAPEPKPKAKGRPTRQQ